MSDVKKIFDGVFGGSNKIQESDHPMEKRGVPVRLSIFDVSQIHSRLVKAYDAVETTLREIDDAKWKLYQAKTEFQLGLLELEIRISAQEKESGITGTQFRTLKGESHERDE